MKFTHYTQLDQMDCGPTCLRMVAKHYGRVFSLQDLREKTQIGKNGVSLLGIAEAAEAIGFRTTGIKTSFEKLATEVPLPCIVHWNNNHFVVVYNVKSSEKWMNRVMGGKTNQQRDNAESTQHRASDKYVNNKNINYFDASSNSDNHQNNYRAKVYVADPGGGLLTYDSEEFCKYWLTDKNEGIVLLLEPTPLFNELDESEQSKSLQNYGFEKLWNYLWHYKKLLYQLLLGLAIGSCLQLIFPFLTQSVVDIGINTHNLSFVYLVLSAQLMLMLGRLSIEFIRSWIILHISTRVNLNILSDFIIKLMRLPTSFFDSKHFGDIMQRIGDHHRIESFLTGQTLTILFSLLNFVIFGIILAIYNIPIFFVFIVASLLYIGWITLFFKRRRILDFKRFSVASRHQSSTVQLVQGIHEIKLAGAERPMRWNWEKLQVNMFRLQMRGLSLNQYQQAGAFAINETKNILITFMAAQSVINGQLSLGAMLAMQQIVGQLNGPIEQFIGFLQGFQDAKISLERLNEIHNLPDEEIAGMSLSNPIEEHQSLKLQELTFKYNDTLEEPVLKGVSLYIPAGKTTAIVGMSGSGKTTLLKLLLKFYEPISGQILVNEVNMKNISHSHWRNKCGVVMQDGYIFSDTIARNIAVGVDQIDHERLIHAIKIANLQSFVDSLASGLNTKIGADGNGVSQGQRQRILIARAVYKNPRYIFFDEATNALDSNNEAVIMDNLNRFFVGRTVIVVAHRLSTVCNADQIVVLEKGQIVEVGTHSQLVEQRGNYWQLVKNQLELGM